MDDLKFGTRNKRGDWTPNATAGIATAVHLPAAALKRC